MQDVAPPVPVPQFQVAEPRILLLISLVVHIKSVIRASFGQNQLILLVDDVVGFVEVGLKLSALYPLVVHVLSDEKKLAFNIFVVIVVLGIIVFLHVFSVTFMVGNIYIPHVVTRGVFLQEVVISFYYVIVVGV